MQYNVLILKKIRKKSTVGPRYRRESDVKLDFKQIRYEGID